MLSFWPTRRLSRVDLPAFGRPARVTIPARVIEGSGECERSAASYLIEGLALVLGREARELLLGELGRACCRTGGREAGTRVGKTIQARCTECNGPESQ